MNSRFNFIIIIIIIIFVSLLFSFCTADKETLKNEGTSETIVDDTNYTIKVFVAERIVSLAPSNTEILFAIGAGEKVVGVTDYCNYPPEVIELKKMGKLKTVGGFTTVNIERVLALKPDLVVAAYGNGIQTIEALRRMNLTVVAFNPKNLSDIERSIIILGKLTGNEDKAKEVVEEMKSKISLARKHVVKKLKVAHIIWHDPIWVSGRETFVDEIIKVAGGENAFNFTGWRVVSVEDIVAADPDVIIVNSGTGMLKFEDLLYKQVVSDKVLKELRVVKEGRVYIVDADLFSRPSHRFADAVLILSKILSSASNFN